MNQHKNIFLKVLDFSKILWYNTTRKAGEFTHKKQITIKVGKL